VSALTNSSTPLPSPLDGRALHVAEEAYRKVLALQPRHFRTLCSLATVRLQLGDAQEARTLLDRAADVAGDSADLHLTVGKAFAGLGDLAKATSHFARAAALDESSIEPRLLLGGALYGLGDPAAAVRHGPLPAHGRHRLGGMAHRRAGQDIVAAR